MILLADTIANNVSVESIFKGILGSSLIVIAIIILINVLIICAFLRYAARKNSEEFDYEEMAEQNAKAFDYDKLAKKIAEEIKKSNDA